MRLERNIKLLAWHNFFTDFRLYAPVAILYYAQVSGSYALGMSIFSITMLTQAMFELPAGIFSDLVGRAKTVTWGSAAMVLGMIGLAIGGNYWWLVFGAIMEGLSRAFYSGNNDALLHDTLSDLGVKELYADKLGKLSSLFQAALAVSAVLGSLIANWSFGYVMWLSVIPQLGCVVVSIFLREPRVASKTRVNPYVHLNEAFVLFMKNPKLRLLSLANAFGSSTGEAVHQFNATFIASLWPVWAIGIAKGLVHAGASLSFYFAGWLIKRFKEYPILIWARVYGRIISLVAYSLPSLSSPVLLASISLFYGTITVADNNLKQKEYTQKQRATMASLDSLFVSIMIALLSVMVGAIADWTSPVKALLIMQIFQTVPLVIYWALWKQPKN